MWYTASLSAVALACTSVTSEGAYGNVSVNTCVASATGSPGLPVAEHFNSANHTIDDISVSGIKQCSASNTSRNRREMQLNFELGMLKPGGLNINFSFI